MSAIVAGGVYAYYAKDLPSAEEIGQRTMASFESTKIYDRTGQHLLFEFLPPEGGARTMVPLSKIPAHMRLATIAIEDKTFYENPGGINFRGILRAFMNNLMGLPVQGGSSITQQLVRNVVMTPEERFKISYERKIKEVILSLELTRRYPGLEGKDKILEWYLNTVSYGNLAYGVEAAAQTYFGKSAEELTLAEAAMLAAVPQYPALNPIDNWEEAKKRQEIVLDQMYLQGYISADEAYAAKQEPIHVVSKRFDIVAPHFVMYVRKLLEDLYGPENVDGSGFRVYTTLNLDIQKEAERITVEHMSKVPEERNAHNAAVVVLDAPTGQILAMVGSLDYFDPTIDGQVNMATSPRQPGSSFKPFTYVTAFAQGYTPATMLLDVRRSFPDWPNPPYVPENHDRVFHGPMTVRRALACSYNVPAVEMLYRVGVKNVLETAHRMGINTLTDEFYGLSLTLGGGEVTLLDMTYAYSVFANQGIMVGQPVPPEKQRPGFRKLDPIAILRIEDSFGNVLYENGEPEREEILRPQLAYLITDILSDNRARTPSFGPDSVLKLSRPAAVKTGTTNNYFDAWTIGYTPQVVVGVWVGNSDRSPMDYMPGSRAAGPIWHDIMEAILAPLPEVWYEQPPGLKRVEVDSVSGLLPTQYSPARVRELFIEGTEPTAYDNVHRPFRICKVSGKLATVYCPPDAVEEKVFEIYPSEAADWVREQGIPQPPTAYCDVHGPSLAGSDVAILSPHLYSHVRGIVPVIGNAKPGNFKLYRLQYGEGMNPSAWTQIGGDHWDRVDNSVLEYWDVTQLEGGLYSLQLVVLDKHDNYMQSTIQVTVDNSPPTIEIIHPLNGAVYVKEQDEWINIQVDARDNFSMDRVEFFLDGQSVGFTTVAPFTKRWTIVMSDTIPIAPRGITGIVLINESGYITLTQDMLNSLGAYTGTLMIHDGTCITLTQVFPSGMSIISDTMGYTETHAIHAIAYDAAGNQSESEKVQVFVIHKPKEKPKVTPTPVAILWPPNWSGAHLARARPPARERKPLLT